MCVCVCCVCGVLEISMGFSMANLFIEQYDIARSFVNMGVWDVIDGFKSNCSINGRQSTTFMNTMKMKTLNE